MAIQMKTSKLEILDIPITLNENEEFWDDGFVDSMRDYKIKLLKKYNSYQPEEELSKKVFGTHGTFWVGPKTYYHIAYEDQLEDIRNINTRAHEETHVLTELGYLDILTNKMKCSKINLDLNLMLMFNERELIAELGGIYAIQKLGINPRSIMQFRDKTFQSALDLYEKAIQKAIQKTIS
jgi:hypothetical protein